MNTRIPALRLGLAATLALGAALAAALPLRAATDPATRPATEHRDPAALPLEALDSDGNGIVSAPEMGTWLRAHGDLSRQSTTALGAASIARLDRDRDGNYTVADRAEPDASRTLIEWQAPAHATDRVATDDGDD